MGILPNPKNTSGPHLTLFNGKTPDAAILIFSGLHNTYAIMDTTMWADEEISNMGVETFLPDAGDLTHTYYVVSFKSVISGVSDWDNCTPEYELEPDEYIEINPKQVNGHFSEDPTSSLWLEVAEKEDINPIDIRDVF